MPLLLKNLIKIGAFYGSGFLIEFLCRPAAASIYILDILPVLW